METIKTKTIGVDLTLISTPSVAMLATLAAEKRPARDRCYPNAEYQVTTPPNRSASGMR